MTMMTSLTALHADGVSRFYDGRAVVKDASLTLEPGKITALLGQSGAGKSTLLRLFAGLEPVDAGEIRLGGTVLSSTGVHIPAEKRAVGLIFQDFALFPHLSALDNVGFGLPGLAKPDRRKRAGEWLDRLGLSHRARAFPHQLSGGEQQRVSIARALAAQPVAILMDEPFSGLDVTLKSEVRSIALAAVADAGIPALLVSHDADEAMRDADRIAVMKDGVVLQEDTPERLYLSPASLPVARALGPMQGIDRASLPSAWAVQLPPMDRYWMRPEAIRVTSDGNVPMTVIAARRASSLIELDLESADGARFRALDFGTVRPEPGDKVNIALDPAFVFNFGDGKG